MNSTKIPSFFTKEYFVIYLLSLGIFCFSVWGTKAGMIPCILGFLLFLKNNKINKTQIVKDLYPIRWWIFVNLGILSMAFISLFFCFDILQTLKAIVFFLIIPLFIFLCFFLVFKRSDSKIQKTGLTLIFSVFILHTICTIMVFFSARRLTFCRNWRPSHYTLHIIFTHTSCPIFIFVCLQSF